MRSRSNVHDVIIRSLITGLLVGVAFIAGFLVRERIRVTAQDTNSISFPLLSEVHQLVSEHYLRDMPQQQNLEYGAIRGYLGELNDPYTFFIDPPVAQSESDVLAGQYGGIGVQVKRDQNGAFVLFPFRDSPAAAAGIQDGDILVGINDTAIAPDERLDVIDQLLRGEVGDNQGVTITVQRPGQDELHEMFIEFAVVQVPSVVWRVLDADERIGYVQILRFTSRSPEELRQALTELDTAGVSALILDMRNNAGGLLQESVEVAGEFLDGGVVFYERRRAGDSETLAAEGGVGLNKPLVVLVNSGTASAAELVAGAIRDRGRGILIGQKTFGKGSVQLIFRLSDNSSIHITSSEWFTPARTPLDGNGLEPDIAMIPAEDGRDVELGEAIRYLQEVLIAVADQ